MDERDARLRQWQRFDEWMNDEILRRSGYRQTGDTDDVGLMFGISVEESMWLREECRDA